MDKLLQQIRSCIVCSDYLPFAPRPIVQASPKSRILIIGQAPGLKVQQSGIPFDDQSGDELRRWLGVTREQFYDDELFAIMPMGFCYPGKGASGDLPPRKECAPIWHELLRKELSSVRLVLLIGKYAQDHYLGAKAKGNLTENVRAYYEFLPQYFPLVHPSPRNKIWQKKNPWFEKSVIPELRKIVSVLIQEVQGNRE